MVLDTDTYNEIDDQFALAQCLLSPESLQLEAVYAAPFYNKELVSSVEEGMQKSYEEIHRVMNRLGISADGLVHTGSSRWLRDDLHPVDSPAARDLIKRAHATPQGEYLYVVAIGALTNVISAIIMDPETVQKLQIVWLGGQPLHWHSAAEFNLCGDIHASRFLFNSSASLTMIPCTGVASHLLTSTPEMEQLVRPLGPLGEYLTEIFNDWIRRHGCLTKEIWDIAGPAWLLNPSWFTSELVHRPILTDHITYSIDNSRPFMRMVTSLNRDAIFRDLYKRLASASVNNS
ncbi:MAG: nucleoside hydrolase [Verrucomicrobiota bacterium]|nr:nucleoside hydrolase [Verrucomicrobiota bacterium]